ncbi:MAG: T9SS type A sorting domain-containing protein, partial [Candidatus Hydrothermales bacterium]
YHAGLKTSRWITVCGKQSSGWNEQHFKTGALTSISEDIVKDTTYKTLPILKCKPNISKGIINITYSVPKKGKVTLTLYDISGKVIKTLVNEEKKEGIHKVETKINLPSGVYFLSLETAEFKKITKFVIQK